MTILRVQTIRTSGDTVRIEMNQTEYARDSVTGDLGLDVDLGLQ